MTKAAFFKGIKLWQHFQGWTLSPSGEGGRRVGVGRTRGLVVPFSPNWLTSISAQCSIRPVTAVDDEDRQTAFNIGLSQMVDALILASTSLGPLTWCGDDAQVAAVNAGASAGSGVTVNHDAPGGGWVTAAGRHVLFRNPTTGAGFVAAISSRASGSITCDLESDVTTDWEIVSAHLYYAEAKFEAYSRVFNGPSGDYHSTGGGIAYNFVTQSPVTIAAALQQDLG